MIYLPLLAPHLICLGTLKLLELLLEAQVGGGARSGDLHGCEGVAPAQLRHRHDVGDHQGDTSGDAGQTAGFKGCLILGYSILGKLQIQVFTLM